MHILIADDDPVARLVLNKTLTRLGHTVVAFDNGRDALDALLAPNGPCFAILDWMMPGADGLTVCRAIRERQNPYVYVILLTSRDSLADMVEGLDAGADDFLGKPFDAIELRARLKSGERVLTLQANLLRASAELEHQATHDRLTSLWNRGMILDHLKRTLNRERREKSAVSVIIADIDHFKAVNDQFGHLAGDAVLREIARRMKVALRDYDAIGRYGGEEFLIVVSGEAVLARDLAERLRAAISSTPIADENREVSVTASFGLATTRVSGFDAEALIRAADHALYAAKTDGRNQVREEQ